MGKLDRFPRGTLEVNRFSHIVTGAAADYAGHTINLSTKFRGLQYWEQAPTSIFFFLKAPTAYVQVLSHLRFY